METLKSRYSLNALNKMIIDNHLAVKYQGQSKDDIEMEHIANRARVIIDDYKSSSV